LAAVAAQTDATERC